MTYARTIHYDRSSPLFVKARCGMVREKVGTAWAAQVKKTLTKDKALITCRNCLRYLKSENRQ